MLDDILYKKLYLNRLGELKERLLKVVVKFM